MPGDCRRRQGAVSGSLLRALFPKPLVKPGDMPAQLSAGCPKLEMGLLDQRSLAYECELLFFARLYDLLDDLAMVLVGRPVWNIILGLIAPYAPAGPAAPSKQF